MKKIALIPARYAATRFPGKLMSLLAGKPVIVRTYEATLQTGLFDEVLVVTDSDEIEAAIKKVDGKVFRSIKEHPCGTDRIAEAAMELDADIVVNVQGDEPFVNKETLRLIIEAFEADTKEEIDLVTLMQKLTDWKLIEDPNYVKVIADKDNFALYFSRAVIPYPRDKEAAVDYYEHIGVYGFRKQALIDFYQLPMRPLEAVEKVECIRFLEYGKKIKLIETEYMGIEIDTPADLKNAQEFYSNLK